MAVYQSNGQIKYKYVYRNSVMDSVLKYMNTLLLSKLEKIVSSWYSDTVNKFDYLLTS